MPVVIKSNSGADKKSPVGAWIGYGAVAVFAVAIVATSLLGGPKSADPLDPQYKYNDYKDLADMPFSSDEAEAELLSSVSYKDIAKNDLISALFSEDEKEARQAQDAAHGAPPPPDEEYAQAAKEKAKVKHAKERYQKAKQNAIKARTEKTSRGQMSAQSGIKVGSGGGSGVSHSVWRSKDKMYDTESSRGGRSSADLRNQITQNIKDGGRGGGFMQAYDKSKQAANTDDLEAAHRLAGDAFQNAGDLEGDISGELEETAEAIDLNSAIGDLDKDKQERLANTLDKALDKAKEETEKKERKEMKCDGAMLNGSIDTGCVMGMFLNKLIENGADALKNAFNGKGSKGESGLSTDESFQRNLMLENYKSQINQLEGKNNLTDAERQQLSFMNATVETMYSNPNSSVKEIMGSDTFKQGMRDIQTAKMKEQMREIQRRETQRINNETSQKLLQSLKKI